MAQSTMNKCLAGERERGTTHQDVDERGNKNGAVAAEKRISHKSTQQRQQLRRARPRVHVLRRRGRWLPQWIRQIRYKVAAYPIIRKPLRHFHAYLVIN